MKIVASKFTLKISYQDLDQTLIGASNTPIVP